MMNVALKMNALAEPQTPYVVAHVLEQTHAQAEVIYPREGFEAWENQKWWQEMMPLHGKGLRDGYHMLGTECWKEPSAALIQVGLMGSRKNFQELVSCLPDDIRNHTPPHPITRIVLDKTGLDEQILIHGRNGECVLLSRFGPIWNFEGVYKQVADDGVSVLEISNPPLIGMYDQYERILKIVQEIQKAEAIASEVFNAVNLHPDARNLIQAYSGYQTPREKAQAETRRQELMESLPKDSVAAYHLPAPKKEAEAAPVQAPAVAGAAPVPAAQPSGPVARFKRWWNS